MICSTEICEEIVTTFTAPFCSAGTNCATEQQRIESFQKQVHEESWLFSLTWERVLTWERRKEGEGEKEIRGLGFVRLHQYLKESLNKAPHIHLVHPLVLLTKQQL